MKAKIYTTDNCGWCVKAKALLKRDNIEFEEAVLSGTTVKVFKKECPNASTVPQIIIDGKWIGGYTDLEQFLGWE